MIGIPSETAMVSARGARLEWHGINVRKVDILSALAESRIALDGQHAHPTYKDTMLLSVDFVPDPKNFCEPISRFAVWMIRILIF